MDETKSKPTRMFYVAMRIDPTRGASATCVADDPDLVEEFRRDYADREIRLVVGDDMKRLMSIE